MTTSNPSPRNWRNRYSNAPRGRKVIGWIALGILLGVLCGILSSCLGLFGQALSAQAETVSNNAQSAAPWWMFWNRDADNESVTAADSGAIVDIQFTPAADVLAQLELLGYSSVEEFAQAWGITLGGDLQNANVDPREVGTCPFETQGCIRILREKDQENNVIPFRISNATSCWHDGWRREPGETRPGGYTNPERSGLPPSANGILVEGVTLRVCKDTGSSGTLPGEADVDAPAETLTPTDAGNAANQTSAPSDTSAPSTSTGGANASSWTEASVREEFKLAEDVVLTAEGACFKPNHSSGKFQITNPRSTWVDGWRFEPGTIRPGITEQPDQSGLPPGETVWAVGATLCSN